ncbi:hypothetical protein B0O80DRAFT_432493, partial [Mortierella sp. GBAus27b]
TPSGAFGRSFITDELRIMSSVLCQTGCSSLAVSLLWLDERKRAYMDLRCSEDSKLVISSFLVFFSMLAAIWSWRFEGGGAT